MTRLSRSWLSRSRLSLALVGPALTVAVAVTFALAPACSTDPKKTDVGDASATSAPPPSDAGLLAAADAPDLDAGMPRDAGDLAPDAGAQPVTTAAVTNTGGGEKPNVTTTSNNDGAAPADAGTGTPFDRILIKPKVQGGDAEALKSAVEKKTGHKIALMRKTAGKWFLLQFAPTSKGRSADDQRRLVDVIESMEEIASAEGDRLMKVKQP